MAVLSNLSFQIKCGQTVAVLGSSGSGNSTRVWLLQKFYEVDSGEILIDGIQINEYDRRWLRQQISVISQEPVLFHTTIRECILFGTDSAADEEIHQSAKVANSHDFIMCLPDVYEYKFLLVTLLFILFHRNMKLKLENVEQCYQLDKNKESISRITIVLL